MEFPSTTNQQPQIVVVSSASGTPAQPLIVQNSSSQPQQVYQIATTAIGQTNAAPQIVVQSGTAQQQFQQVQVIPSGATAAGQPGVLQLQTGGQQQQVFQPSVEGQNQIIYQPQTDSNTQAQQIQTNGSGNVVQLPAQLQNLNGQLGNVMVIFQSPQPAATGKDRRVQIGGVQTADVADDPPLYVNAKQYHRILKRRQARQKLEQSGRISKERKSFLHLSRHKHAQNRHRGEGGRFTPKTKSGDGSSSADRSQVNGDQTQGIPDVSTGAMMNTVQTIHQ